MSTAKFISGDGVPHEVNTDSVAFGIMSKDGSFTRVDGSGKQSVVSDLPTPPVPLKRAELIALAHELGVAFKANIKNIDLLALIDAKRAEGAENA